ncbi:DUF4123 domain-containing protein [Pseudomonas frederiksbergensis]|uniref:DUF4123 domain-containing protein n=1 Tax=Pseudomonas frederiksbergensis TaxID=104087 RepID=A0A423KRU8_9PSED|nr:DUF4123 domain-containing protein [Pseudomonas frederiksbergensis]RON58405.1 hypothetical protein BK665_00300 [Pseudomonas frederiksbergensis]
MNGVQTPDPVAQWLLLDVPGAPRTSATLLGQLSDVRWSWLFEGTEWHALRERGPALVDVRDSPALLERCYREPHAWQGLLLFSEASAAVLLEHLRRMLTVTLGLHHRALLSYYNPHCASYFFDACDAEELSRWLGPISQLRWFGGTWADRAIGSQGWQQLLNPGLAVSPLAFEENLSLRQREKLQTCLLEQHAWHWSRSTGTDYNRLWSHVQEGLVLGFSERPVLDDWLWLRLQCPGALPTQPLPGRTQQERLDYLRYLWQGDQP